MQKRNLATAANTKTLNRSKSAFLESSNIDPNVQISQFSIQPQDLEDVVKKPTVRAPKGKENKIEEHPQKQPEPKHEPVKIERQQSYAPQSLMFQPQRSHPMSVYPIGAGPNDDKASHFENYFDYGDNYQQALDIAPPLPLQHHVSFGYPIQYAFQRQQHLIETPPQATGGLQGIFSNSSAKHPLASKHQMLYPHQLPTLRATHSSGGNKMLVPQGSPPHVSAFKIPNESPGASLSHLLKKGRSPQGNWPHRQSPAFLRPAFASPPEMAKMPGAKVAPVLHVHRSAFKPVTPAKPVHSASKPNVCQFVLSSGKRQL